MVARGIYYIEYVKPMPPIFEGFEYEDDFSKIQRLETDDEIMRRIDEAELNSKCYLLQKRNEKLIEEAKKKLKHANGGGDVDTMGVNQKLLDQFDLALKDVEKLAEATLKENEIMKAYILAVGEEEEKQRLEYLNYKDDGSRPHDFDLNNEEMDTLFKKLQQYFPKEAGFQMEDLRKEFESAINQVSRTQYPMNKTGADVNKTGADENKTGADENKTGADGNKTGTSKNKTGANENKVGADEKKTGADEKLASGDSSTVDVERKPCVKEQTNFQSTDFNNKESFLSILEKAVACVSPDNASNEEPKVEQDNCFTKNICAPATVSNTNITKSSRICLLDDKLADKKQPKRINANLKALGSQMKGNSLCNNTKTRRHQSLLFRRRDNSRNSNLEHTENTKCRQFPN